MAGIVDEREWENIYRRIVKGEYGLDGILQGTHDRTPDGLNIIAVIHDKATACEEYRVVQPLQEIEKLGHNCYIMNAGYLMERTKKGIDDFMGADLILFNRMTDNYEVKIAEIARAHGAAVVCDYDDDLTNQYRKITDDQFPKLDGFDAITVSTEWLKVLYAGRNKHIYVLPNMIQKRRFENWQRDIHSPTIGLTGSVTHERDWKVVLTPVLNVLAIHKEWRLFVSGYFPPELADHPQVIVPDMVKPEWAKGGMTIPYAKYGWLMRQIDILLIPVDPIDKFNWAKSSLKFREAAAAGCAVIATGKPLPCYASDIIDGVNGLLVQHDERSWEEAIERMVVNTVDRTRIAMAAKEASVRFEASYGTQERLRVYRTIIDRRTRRHLRTT